MRRLALFPIILLLAACGGGAPSPTVDVASPMPIESGAGGGATSPEASLDAGSPAGSLDAQSSESPDMAAVVSPECREAFDPAAAAIAGNNTPDALSDFFPAVRECTLDEWRTELMRLGGEDFAANAESLLRDVCAAPEIANEDLCTQLN